MDSSSSGSMHSSGGGDEEFDSRGDSILAFLNSSRTSNHAWAEQLPPPRVLPSQYQNHPSSLFDPQQSTSLGIFTQSTAPPSANFDMMLSRGFTSAPSSSQQTNSLTGPSSSRAQQVPLYPTPFPKPSSSSIPSSSGNESSPRAPTPSDPSNVVARNPKKRTRASRRAPTTVLTTDTSNFRAMVQEFTGIPPPPFSASPFPGRGLNLFNTSSTRFGLESQLSYPLRPFAHKVLPPSFLSSSRIAPIASSTTNIANTTSKTSSSNTSTTIMPTTNSSNTYPTLTNNYQVPSELDLSRQSQNSLNMQNPMLAFQSHLPTSSRTDSQNLNLGVLEEFNMNHGQLNTEGVGSNDENLSHVTVRSANEEHVW